MRYAIVVVAALALQGCAVYDGPAPAYYGPSTYIAPPPIIAPPPVVVPPPVFVRPYAYGPVYRPVTPYYGGYRPAYRPYYYRRY